MRRAARVDDNHLAIVRALEKAGAAVTSLATVGDGVADLLVSYRNRWHVIEVKDGSKPPSARKLRDRQKTWIAKQHATVAVILGVDDALLAIGALLSR